MDAGIGRGIAIKLAECGAQVVGISRTQADLGNLKEQVPSIDTHSLDLTDWDATRVLVQSLGQIDLLVNKNGTPKKACNSTQIIWQLTMCPSTFHGQIVAKGMVERGKGGAIVMMSSEASFRAIDAHSVYCSAKGAYGPAHKIRVNCVNPTIIMTDLAVKCLGNPEKAKPVLNRIPLGRFNRKYFNSIEHEIFSAHKC